MNANIVAEVARGVSERVAAALAECSKVLVLGGDCTVELGTVAGASRTTQSIGLVYIDLDTDLNTPLSTTDGALDWMGVAHMLGLPDTVPELASLGPRSALLDPRQVLYFGVDNIEPFERQQIDNLGIQAVRLAQVAADPAHMAQHMLSTWGQQFDALLVHLDVDVLDFVDMPLAENNRRNWGLTFSQLMAALQVFLRAPNWAALTICEVNPDHGEADGSTLRTFAEALSKALAFPGRGAR
jgi:arginase